MKSCFHSFFGRSILNSILLLLIVLVFFLFLIKNLCMFVTLKFT